MKSMIAGMMLAAIGMIAGGRSYAEMRVVVRTDDELRAAIRSAAPGTRIRLAPGEYRGGMYFRDICGTAEQPIVIGAADPAHPPRIVGGNNGFHFAAPAHLELHDLILTGAAHNGLNVDDGGNVETPASHIRLRNLHVSDVGPEGNCDGLKLSGVTDFRIEGCVIERWGDRGQGVDLVGCHRGVVEGNTFRHGRDSDHGAGVQVKGGSSEVVIRRNRFEQAGARGVNIGGSTGLEFFRPAPQGWEARDIRVEGNIFIGSDAPVAFVNTEASVVRFNTIYHPRRWALRILQEQRHPDFLPCRNGRFEDNLIVFRYRQWFEGGVNIGPDTAPETFRFARNLWFCEDEPEFSEPRLPTDETDGLYGLDPQFRDPDRGDFSVPEDHPAAPRGAHALPAL